MFCSAIRNPGGRKNRSHSELLTSRKQSNDLRKCSKSPVNKLSERSLIAKMKETAIVVGAGLGGMTAALSLAFHGFKEVCIYEKSTKILNPIGAGIGITGSTLCLDKINLSHVWKNAGHAVHSTRITAGNDKPTGFDIKRLLKGTILEDHFLAAKRNTLMKELWAECEKNPKIKTQLGVKITEYKNTENGAEVTFADGTTDSADIVVSADGIHSLGRDFVDPDCPPPEHSGLCVFYCLLENVDKEKFPDNSTIEVHLNMGMAMLMRISETDAMIVVAHQASEKWNVNSQNWTFDVSPEIFHELMEDHGFYKEQEWIDEKMIKSVTNLSHLGIYQQPHVSNWFRGNVILIGDAAHATSPFMGQGANQAMIDGYYLGRCLQDCKDIPSAFDKFYKARDSTTRKIIDSSKDIGHMRTGTSFWNRIKRSGLRFGIKVAANVGVNLAEGQMRKFLLANMVPAFMKEDDFLETEIN